MRNGGPECATIDERALAFSNADVGKTVNIIHTYKVLVDGRTRNVNWGDAAHKNMQGAIASVEGKYKGKVELEDGQAFENGYGEPRRFCYVNPGVCPDAGVVQSGPSQGFHYSYEACRQCT